jgi:hypothetical protein
MSEDLVNAMEDAKHFSRVKGENLNVIGWYHSHPHITVWPSSVGKCHRPLKGKRSMVSIYNFATSAIWYLGT